MRSSTTVGQAMRCASRYIHAYNAAIRFFVGADEGGDQASFTFELLAQDGPPCAQMVEHGVGITSRILRMLSGGRSRPNHVWLPHPAVASRATYRRHLAAPVEFRASHAAMTIDRAGLDLPLAEHDEELRALALDYLDVRFPSAQPSFQIEVRSVVDRLLGTGTCGITEVADALSMHPRTLQRRLRADGTTFEDIKDEARRDRAQRYLAHAGVPLAQVSAALDYSEQSALTRSYQRWFRMTPSALRSHLATGTTVSPEPTRSRVVANGQTVVVKWQGRGWYLRRR